MVIFLSLSMFPFFHFSLFSLCIARQWEKVVSEIDDE